MARIRSMTRNQNCDGSSSSSRKRVNGGVAPWSDLDHHLLFLVMMQLGVIDFVAFSGVCKSWRALALDNRKIFMASRPPMLISISHRSCKKEWYCYLEDLEGRKFKTILPHAAGRICVGITCGYLILFGRKTKDFWLVNLITRHELHFPCFPFNTSINPESVGCILVFSPLVSGWVFVVLLTYTYQIWFSMAGSQAWNRVYSTSLMIDLHAFKGKIYTINIGCRVYEMRLNPEPKLTLLHTKNFPKPDFLCPEFLSSSENLYVMDCRSKDSYEVHYLDFEEMKSVSWGKTFEECAFFVNSVKYSAAIKSESLVDHRSLYKRFAYFLATIDTSRKGRFLPSHIWYFPNDCLNVNRLDE